MGFAPSSEKILLTIIILAGIVAVALVIYALSARGVRREPWAIASFVLSLFWIALGPLAPLLAIGTGWFALHRIRTDPTRHGRGFARLGVGIGLAELVAIVVLVYVS